MLEHPAVELRQQVGGFGQRQDFAGVAQLAGAVAHAQQHLELGFVATGNRDHRLEGQLQAIAGQGIADLAQQAVRGRGGRNAGRNIGTDAGGIRARRACAFLGGRQRRAGIVEAMRQIGMADGGAQADRLFADMKIVVAHAVAQAACQRFEWNAARIGDHHQEGVVAEAGGGMRLHQGAEMAAGIVHQLLELGIAVVVAQGRHVACFQHQYTAAALRKQGTQLLHQRGPGEQAGDRVVLGFCSGGLAVLRDACTSHAALHRGDQVARAHRFEDVVIATVFQCLQLPIRILVAGQEHHRHLREARMFADLHGQAGAAGTGHVQIHQHQVGIEALHRRHHLFGHGDDFGLHAGTAQDGLGEQGLAAVVLDDQDAVRQICGCVGHGNRRGSNPRILPGDRKVGSNGLRIGRRAGGDGRIDHGAPCRMPLQHASVPSADAKRRDSRPPLVPMDQPASALGTRLNSLRQSHHTPIANSRLTATTSASAIQG